MSLKFAFMTPAIALSALLIGFGPATALAQDAVTPETAPPPIMAPTADILPVKSAAEADVVIDETSPTHPAVKLTPDKSELIRLERKASAVIIGNPAHLSILPEGSDILVLVPKAPGATYFTVLDEENKIIMQRHVIVAAPKEKYVRIRKACGGSNDCQTTQVYYCPDMCHEIIMGGGESKSGGGKAAGKADNVVAEEAKDNAENAETGAADEGQSDSQNDSQSEETTEE